MLNEKTPTKELGPRRIARISLPDTYDEQQLVISNDLVAANYRLSLTQLRLVWMFGMLIRKADGDFRHYQVSISDVIKYLRLSQRSGWVYRQIEEAVEGLLGNVLHVPRKDTNGWLKFTWVSSAEYRRDDGTIEFEFSDKLKPFLLRLTGNFTVAEMSQLMQLRSVYSGRIYLLLKQYRKIGKIRFDLDKLRLLLSLDVVGEDNRNPPYERYQDFRRYVLEQAQKELMAKTDLSFSFKPIKTGRKISGIEFVITGSVAQQGAQFPALPDSSHSIAQELMIVGFKESHAIRLLSRGWTNVPSNIRDEIDSEVSFEQYVFNKLSLLQKARAKRDVDNPVGWLVKAIRENWTDGPRLRPRNQPHRSSGRLQSLAEIVDEMTLPDDERDVQ